MGYRSSRRRSRTDDTQGDQRTAAGPPSLEAERATTGRRGERDADRPHTLDRAAADTTGTRRHDASDQARTDTGPGHVAYDPGPDAGALGERYGLEIERREAGRLQRLEAEFGRERVGRWAEEGMPVEAMGNPRDMRAFRSREADAPDATGGGLERGSGTVVQPKLEMSSPDDPAEREADRVAEEVLSMGVAAASTDAAVTVDSATAASASNGGGRGSGETVPADTEATVRKGVRGRGKPLPAHTRRGFESTLGTDLSHVQIHTGTRADDAARSIRAEAYTIGSDVAFADGKYDPGSRSGRKLLAHELTHVVQQSDARGDGTSGASPSRRVSGERVQRGLLGDAVSSVKSAAESAAESAKGAAESAAESAKGAAESAAESAGAVLGDVTAAGESALQSAGQAVQALASGASNLGSKAMNLLERGGDAALDMLQQSKDAVVNMVADGGQRAWNILRKSGERAWAVLRSGGTEVWDAIKREGQMLWTTLRENGQLLVDMVREGGQQVWTVLRNGGRKAWHAVQSARSEVWNALRARGRELWSLLRENGQFLAEMVRRGGQRAWEILRQGGHELWAAVRSAGSEIWSALRANAHRLWGLVRENAQFLVDLLVSGGRRAWSLLETAGHRLWAAIRHGGSEVWAAIQRAGSRFWAFLARSERRLWRFLEQSGQWVWNVLESVRHLLWDFVVQAPERLVRVISHLARAATAVPRWFIGGVRRLLTDPSALGGWLRQGLQSAASWTGRLVTRLLDLVGVGEAFDMLSEFLSVNSRGLTSTEASEAGDVLGGTVDYGQVRVDEHSVIASLGAEIQNASGMAVTTFHTLHFEEPIEASAGSSDMAWLIHELTHVAQYETVGSQYMPESIHAQTAGAGYDYSYDTLTSGSIGDFNREQQASIVEDYYAHVMNSIDRATRVTGAPDDLFENYESDYAGTYEPHIEAIRSGRL